MGQQELIETFVTKWSSWYCLEKEADLLKAAMKREIGEIISNQFKLPFIEKIIGIKTKYRFIHFEEMEWLNTGKTKHYECLNNKTNYSLGLIEWERGWRQYIFSPSGADIILSVGCLLDIIDFIKQLKSEL